MPKTRVCPESYTYQTGVLERNVIVEILAPAAGCAPCGLLGIGPGPATAAGPAAGRALRPGARASAAARPAAAPAPEHLHVVTDDLGRVALIPLLVLPLAGAQASLDVDLRTLAQVLA